jgi:hypothetical protein
MKNLIGAILSFIVGSLALYALGLDIPEYPVPYGTFAIFLAASSVLLNTFSTLSWGIDFLQHLLAWLLIGFLSGLFSDGTWTNVRTAVWVGLVIGTVHLASTLLLNPSFWYQTDRNVVILVSFILALLTSQLSLVSSIPATLIVNRIRAKEPPEAPERIETRCQCGAVFKSNPILCSECGRVLEQKTQS